MAVVTNVSGTGVLCVLGAANPLADPETPVYEQEGFRWRNDDGNESAATWRQAQDIDDSDSALAVVRLRVLTNITNVPATPSDAKLQFKLVTDADSEWEDLA